MLGRAMTTNMQPQHAIETYKSLIQIAIEGFKLVSLFNGGAAVAILAYLGNIAGKGGAVPDMRLPMSLFLAGLFFCALAMLAGYLTQLSLYNETVLRPATSWYQEHVSWLWIAIGLVFLGILAFGICSYNAVVAFK
jgi:hypothetical protein